MTKGIAVKIVLYAFLLLLFLLALYMLASMTSGFGGRIQNMQVTVNDKTIDGNAGGFVLYPDVAMYVDVRHKLLDVTSLFQTVTAEKQPAYTIQILPNKKAAHNFELFESSVLDDTEAALSFFEVEDYSDCFTITYDETGFLLSAKGDIYDIVQGLREGGLIVSISAKDIVYDMFLLRVISNISGECCDIAFTLAQDVSGVITSQEVLVF